MNKEQIVKLIEQYPLVQQLIDLKELVWFNPNITTLEEGLPYVGLTAEDVKDASDRLKRFAPYLCKAFPETAVSKGIIESEIQPIPTMQAELGARYNTDIKGKMLLKKDSHLPISGSIKARGGIYEVLKHAEKLVKISSVPVFLAGGITPINVRAAINQIKPYGVDLSSGVEKKPGQKDPKKITELMQKIKTMANDNR